MKYLPELPEHLGSLQHARSFITDFVEAYNHVCWHSGRLVISAMNPIDTVMTCFQQRYCIARVFRRALKLDFHVKLSAEGTLCQKLALNTSCGKMSKMLLY